VKVLPPLTAPPPRRRRRRHRPKKARGRKGYRGYRDCLRWEFAFSCAFCLLHEADLAHRPPEWRRGRRDFDIEHLVGQKEDPRRINDYPNLYYCCAPCNAARSTQPVRAAGGRLLDPCRVGWGSRYRYDGFELRPRSAHDRDAIRTLEVYDLNSQEKVAMRECRAKGRAHAEEKWRQVELRIASIRARLRAHSDPELVEVERALWERKESILNVLRRYPAVPTKAPRGCRCPTPRARLPRWLAQQCSELPVSPEVADPFFV
jgi:hypothetical protein